MVAEITVSRVLLPCSSSLWRFLAIQFRQNVTFTPIIISRLISSPLHLLRILKTDIVARSLKLNWNGTNTLLLTWIEMTVRESAGDQSQAVQPYQARSGPWLWLFLLLSHVYTGFLCVSGKYRTMLGIFDRGQKKKVRLCGCASIPSWKLGFEMNPGPEQSPSPLKNVPTRVTTAGLPAWGFSFSSEERQKTDNCGAKQTEATPPPLTSWVR